jgi:ELWxxDGT repeat protein
MNEQNFDRFLIKDINPGSLPASPFNPSLLPASSFPNNFITINGKAYFVATTTNEGAELWTTDGSAAGTQLLRDLQPGSQSSFPNSFYDINGTLLFFAADSAGVSSLYRSDGTGSGTTLVKKVNGVFAGSKTIYNNNLYFLNGSGLWKSDGTTAGTVLIKQNDQGEFTGESFQEIKNIGGQLVFTTFTTKPGLKPTYDSKFWTVNNSDTFTLLKNFNGNGASVASINSQNGVGYLATQALDGRYITLWKAVLSGDNNSIIEEVRTFSDPINPIGPSTVIGIDPRTPIVSIGEKVFFITGSGDATLTVWTSDGTSAGTKAIKTISDGSSTTVTVTGNTTTITTKIRTSGSGEINGKFYFVVASDSPTKYPQVWVSDGTPEGTVNQGDIIDSAGNPVLSLVTIAAKVSPPGDNTILGNKLIGPLNTTQGVELGGLDLSNLPSNSPTTGNTAPILATTIANKSSTKGTSLVFSVASAFSDSDAGDVLTYGATLANGSPLPSWLKLDSTTGLFSGIPTDADVVSLNLRVKATDKGGLSSPNSDFTLSIAAVSVPITVIPGVTIDKNVFTFDQAIKGFGIKAVSQKPGTKVNQILALAVDDAAGTVNGLAPTAPGYLAAVLDRAKPVFSTLGGEFFNSSGTQEVAVDPAKVYQFIQIRDASIADVKQQLTKGIVPTNILYSLGSADSPIKVTNNINNDGYKVSINNDELVLNVGKLAGTVPNPPIGSGLQSAAEGRLIDLSAFVGQMLKVDLTTKSSAVYNNNIGFYQVEDAAGTIKLADGTLLTVDKANYALEAVKKAVLAANKTDSKANQDIAGGAIYAPVMVSQGSLADFISKNPTNGGGGWLTDKTLTRPI